MKPEQPLNRREIRIKKEEKARREYIDAVNMSSRRQFIHGGMATLAILAASLGASAIAQVSQDPLEALVNQARYLENNYRGRDLSDRGVLNEYTKVIADIFSRHSHYSTVEQLFRSVNFVGTHREYGRLFDPEHVDKHEYLGGVLINGGIFVDIEHRAFRLAEIKKDATAPRDWSPLKSVRASLFHHLYDLMVIPNAVDPTLTYFDPTNLAPAKLVRGFGVKNIGSAKDEEATADFDTVTCELLSKGSNRELFGRYDNNSYFSPISNQAEFAASTSRLERVCLAASISGNRLRGFHTSSQLGDFLTALADKAEVSSQYTGSTLAYGMGMVNAVLGTDNTLFNSFIAKAGKR